ncbi:unnamed protein product [Dibothriocephalus latus]|uniref:Uncharacterized protein n=1 Tax=Dibothriocephalus latus TaxID=60516 RepID=A0A3P7P9P9_DIBLA|nr:unnamed protein product [Dibothriocephalus latus]
MLEEQQAISRGAQSDRAYRQLSTEVLCILNRDEDWPTECALVEIFNPTRNSWQKFRNMPFSRDATTVILNSKYPELP